MSHPSFSEAPLDVGRNSMQRAREALAYATRLRAMTAPQLIAEMGLQAHLVVEGVTGATRRNAMVCDEIQLRGLDCA